MRQIQDAFDVTGFVAEENSGPTDKNGKRFVPKLEFSIIIEKEHNPNPGSERKKKKHKRAVQGGKGAGGLDLRSGGGKKTKKGRRQRRSVSISSFPLVMIMVSRLSIQMVKPTRNICSDLN